jgi:N-acyl-D-amino-acid deacylase
VTVPDLIIRNGTVVDGRGGDPFRGDVAIVGERIDAIGDLKIQGREELDAGGLYVTPGFVDVHTHYDGQVTWSNTLVPSSGHGVTTVVVGNCGVGFAPCRAEDRAALINVMQGVEDIPEAVMAEGLPWNWETFPDYLDALAARRWDADVAAYLPHSPLRVYVMGQRALDREPATDADLKRMQGLVEEAMAAGAMGFSTSRTLVHRRADGEFIPSFRAGVEELAAIAGAVGRSGHGIVQMIPNLDSSDYDLDVQLLIRMARVSGRPVTYSLAQWLRDVSGWRKTLNTMDRCNSSEGTRLVAQVFPRPMAVIGGLDTSVNPFSLCPSYAPLAILPLAERVAAMRDPARKSRLLDERPLDAANPMYLLMRDFGNIYPMGREPNYEPDPGSSIAALAERRGIDASEMAYEALLEDDGHALLFVPFANYCEHNLDAALAMMRDPNSVIGLGDGGAHYGLICDASYPTTLLTHWTRDRDGERVSLPWAIKALAADTSRLVGLHDRGRIAVGLKADLNLIDHDRLRLFAPRVASDLPGGRRRLVQDAEGYRATIVSGVVTRRNGRATGALPGRLVRGRAGDDSVCTKSRGGRDPD